jgi:hypothetical protein
VSGRVAWGGGLAASVLVAVAAGAAGAPPRLELRPASVPPGGIAVAVVDEPGLASARVTGRFRDAPLAFFVGDDGRARALIGVDLGTAPGSYGVVVEIAPPDPTGAVQGLRAALAVHAQTFAREDLTVSREYVAPDARTRARIARERERLEAVLARTSPRRRWRGPFLLPAAGPLGSPFGLRRFFNGEERSPHAGQDIRVPEGTPVAAAESGRAVLAADLFFSGKTVVLDHGLGLFTLYFHLATFRVEEGALVDRGTLIGTSGKTGRVTGPHLHWAVRLGGARVDPLLLTSLEAE